MCLLPRVLSSTPFHTRTAQATPGRRFGPFQSPISLTCSDDGSACVCSVRSGQPPIEILPSFFSLNVILERHFPTRVYIVLSENSRFPRRDLNMLISPTTPYHSRQTPPAIPREHDTKTYKSADGEIALEGWVQHRLRDYRGEYQELLRA